MKVILVNGSPHEKGCTYTALNEVALALTEEGIDAEIYWIGNKPIAGCIGCKYCRKAGRCVVDDGVNAFKDIAKDADGFIFGTPVHFAAASGAITSFMDRLFYSDIYDNDNKTFYMKPAATVISARRAGTTAAFDQINKYFTYREMPIVSSRYWNMVHGAQPEDVLKDAEGLYTMRVLGRNMAFLLKCIRAGIEAGIPLPIRETPIYTNFIDPLVDR